MEAASASLVPVATGVRLNVSQAGAAMSQTSERERPHSHARGLAEAANGCRAQRSSRILGGSVQGRQSQEHARQAPRRVPVMPIGGARDR